ncbi:hypothetical protein H311_02771 [Anncaliia algerae PRA109]|nr:hypothetical protein H311_02771 [Anncaliia algerae PRA109]
MLKSGFLISCNKNKEALSQKEIISTLSLLSYKPYIMNNAFDYELELQKILTNLKKNHFDIINLKNTQSIYMILCTEDVLNIFYKINQKFKYTHKIIPLKRIHSFVDFNKLDYRNLFDDFIEEINKLENITYKIYYSHRNTNKEIKNSIINYIADRVQLKVDLCNPDYLFIVEVIKNYIGCSIIENRNFNFNIENN